MRKIILASSSPRRKEILKRANIPFRVETSNYEEDMTLDLKPEDLVKYLSEEKAKDIAFKYKDAIIIGADTLISFQGKVLGKPGDKVRAKEMLKSLSGKSHSVFTGYAILDTKNGKKLTNAVETKVYFNKLLENEIDEYVATGEPIDRVGSYSINGLGRKLINRIDGDYDNVVGLPLQSLAKDLKKFGVNCLVN